MAEGRIGTADELLALSPNERHEVIQAGIVADIDSVPTSLLEQARRDVADHVARTESHRRP